MAFMNARTLIPPIRLCSLLALSVPGLFAGCATDKPALPTQYPSAAKDWHGMDSVDFERPWRLDNFARLVVEPLAANDTKLPPKDENTYEPVAAIIRKADTLYTNGISRGLHGKIGMMTTKPDPAEKALLLRGKLAEVNPGSQAARYWAGFGAGAASVRITGEVVDAKSGDVLLKFNQLRAGAVGAFGGSYDGLLTDCIVSIGRDVGRMLGYFKSEPAVLQRTTQ